jgi:glycerophosphoryl diester phosphodiesterase
LIRAFDVDFKTGLLIYGTTPEQRVLSQPTDWKLAGLSALYDSMLTPAGLATIKTYADGIAPWKPMVVPVKCVLDAGNNCTDLDDDAVFGGYPDANSQPPTTLVADAHKLGLFVHAYNFASETGYYNLPADAKGVPAAEYAQHDGAGVDGVFSDVVDTGLSARAAFLAGVGYVVPPSL